MKILHITKKVENGHVIKTTMTFLIHSGGRNEQNVYMKLSDGIHGHTVKVLRSHEHLAPRTGEEVVTGEEFRLVVKNETRALRFLADFVLDVGKAMRDDQVEWSPQTTPRTLVSSREQQGVGV